MSEVSTLHTDRRIPDDNGIATEELESIHSRRVKRSHYKPRKLRIASNKTSQNSPELSSAVASSTIKRLGLQVRQSQLSEQ